MILKGRCRADVGDPAIYLLSPKNEQVRVLDISGTVIDDRNARGLKEALCEMDELGKMTKATSSLFHLAINPNDKVSFLVACESVVFLGLPLVPVVNEPVHPRFEPLS